MKCKIDGCEREAIYKQLQVCQKHYFRFWRYNTFELLGPRGPSGKPAKRTYRMSNPAGYQKIFEPNHKFADSSGYVYEHRAIVYAIYGDKLPDCELCGKPTNWETCHIDHKDEDVTNNDKNNLRPLCRGCNTSRVPRTKGVQSLTIGDRTLTIMQWSRLPEVTVAHNTIKRRLRDGYTPYDAVFSPSITHPNCKVKKRKTKLCTS